MCSPSEMDAPSEMFFFFVQYDSGMFTCLYLSGLTDLIDRFLYRLFQCTLKPKLNYENKDDKKF